MHSQTVVAVHSWAMNHNPSNFADPWKFIPERFLGDERYATDKLDAVQAFSLGPRNCLGRK